MDTVYANFDEVERSFVLLYEECCDTCMWFWRRAGVPATVAGWQEALRLIEQNGTLQQFERARELKKWL